MIMFNIRSTSTIQIHMIVSHDGFILVMTDHDVTDKVTSIVVYYTQCNPTIIS